MRTHILPIIARAKRCCYIEPFGGTGAVLMRKEPEENEIYNDLNKDIVNLMTVVRTNEGVAAFQKIAETAPFSRAIFYQMRALARSDAQQFQTFKKAAGLVDYDDATARAFAWWYTMKNSFGGNFGSGFGTRRVTPPTDRLREQNSGARYYQNVVRHLQDFQTRLADVVIENLSFEDVFAKYDSPCALFYCDPPYDVPTSKCYNCGWNEEKSSALVELCKGAQGGVVLSCYDSPIYQPLLGAGFKRETFKAMMSVCRDKDKPSKRVETVYYKFQEKE